MDLNDAYTFLNFLINKNQGAWYAPEQLDLIVDRSQMALFNSYYQQFGTSQRLNDALAPFKRNFTFTLVDTPGGLIQAPADYQHLLNVYTIIQNSVTNLPQNRPVPILNEDEKVARDNSQIYPPSTTDPYAMIVQNWNVQLFPTVPQAGIMYYLTRPQAPHYVYSIVSGRVIVYNQGASAQLLWGDKDVASILVKALNYLGINLSEQDITQWSEQKDQININSLKDKI